MRFALSLLAALSLLLSGGAEARPFRGAGTQGFLPTCSGTFNYSNQLLNTAAFGTGWTTAGLGAAAPTKVASNATGPDGSANTATTVTFPAVSGAGNYSQFYQSIARSWIQPTNIAVWARVASGTANGKLYLEVSDATNYYNTPITNDGNWHQINLNVPGSGFVAKTIYVIVGVDLRDSKQVATTGSIAVELYQPQLVERRGPRGGPWPYVASAGTAASTTVTLPCPRNIAFRDFTKLAPYAGNPVTQANASEAYQAGGMAHFMTSQTKVGGKYYAWANSTNTTNHNQWPVFSLYACDSPFKCAEATPGTPILRIPGSNDTGTNGTVSGLSSYMLHPWQSPTGCKVSGTFHPYCYYFSAMDASSHSSIFMAFGDSPTGTFTWYPNSTSPTPLITGQFSTTYPFADPSLPSIVQKGSKLYMFTSHGNNNGTYTVTFSSPTTDGVNWTFETTAWQAPISGVDYNTTGTTPSYIDSAVHKNKCGFYEYYTSLFTQTPSRQYVMYAVSDDPLGPWYKYQAPVIPYGSPLYNGTPYLGDITFTEYLGQLALTMNYDNGTSQSNGMVASMRDACA